MSDNIWNSLSVSAEHRNGREREREEKFFRKKGEKERNNLYRDARTGTNHY